MIREKGGEFLEVTRLLGEWSKIFIFEVEVQEE